MYVLENLKKTLGKVTGVGKPSAPSARRAVRRSKPHAMMFKDDGSIPNNSRLPFLLYRGAVGLTGSADPAGLLEELVPQQFVTKIIPRNRILAIAIGGLLGVLFPMCECGIIPVMRRLLRKGVPLTAVGALLGHESLQSTARYTQSSAKDLREALATLLASGLVHRGGDGALVFKYGAHPGRGLCLDPCSAAARTARASR